MMPSSLLSLSIPQSTIGDKVARVIYQCHTDPDWPTAWMLGSALNIHDALIALNRSGCGVCSRNNEEVRTRTPTHRRHGRCRLGS